MVLKDVSYLFANHDNSIALGNRSARQFWLLCPIPLFVHVHEHTRRWHSSVVQSSKASAEFPSVPANSGKHVHMQRWVCLEFNFSFLAPHWQQSISKKSLQLVPKPVTSALSESLSGRHRDIFTSTGEAPRSDPPRVLLTGRAGRHGSSSRRAC